MMGKRGPGGGRKPEGPFKRKTAQLTTRITWELRSALDREKKRRDWSLSQVVEYLLRQSIEAPKPSDKALGAARNRALGLIVRRLAASIETNTGEDWRKDMFSFEALKSAIEIVLSRLSPDGPVKVPPRIGRSAASLKPHRSEQLFKPDGVGLAVALGFWDQLEILEKPPLDRPKNEHYGQSFYEMPDLRRDLDIKPRKGRN
jgi:hypothetical protein